MKINTLRFGRLLGSLLALAPLGAAVYAQVPATAPIRNHRPDDTDPGYAARKALSIGHSSRVSSAASGTASPTSHQPGLLPSCFEPLDGTFTALPRGDDNFIGPIPLGFTFLLFGTPYTNCYINTNGNISFGQGVSAFSSTGFPNATPMVAAFWADVDTRAPGSGQVYYKLLADRLVVTWDQVSYYTEPATNTALKNSFQLVIRSNTGGLPASPDVSFAYGDMQWTTGDASGGAGGFGGTPSTVGVNEGGSSGLFIQTGRFNQNSSAPPQASYPAGTTAYSGVNWLDNQCIGYTVAPAGNLPPTATGFPAGNVITLAVGQTRNLDLQFAGPEIGQTVTVVPDLTGLCNSSAPVSSGASPIVSFSVTGDACNLGTRTVSFTATDNGSPVQSQTFTLTVEVTALPPTAQWTGAVSSVYTLPGNWSANAVPVAGDNVSIPAGVPNFPVLSAPAAAANFMVSSSAFMTIAAGGDLDLTGDLINNGTFQGAAGALRTSGSASQTLAGIGTGGLPLGELTVGPAGVSLGTALRISRMLVLNGNLTTNGRALQLLSDAANTAMVVNNGAAAVIGDATMQRYISPALNPGTGYRHLSAPVAGVTMGAVAVPGFSPVLNTQYNTQGNTASPFPNMFGYDETRVSSSANSGSTDFDRGFFVPAATSTPFADARGYAVNLPPSGVLAFTGTLHNGSYPSGPLSRGSQTASGWHLLGNPYPAPLDWDAAFAGAAGLENAVYVFKSSGPYAGSYESYVNGVGSARFIASSQGFFVRTATPGAPGALNLTNAARVTAYTNPAFHRAAPGSGDQRPQLRLDLATGTGQQDAAYVYFENGATPAFDRAYDALKLPGGNQLYLATGSGPDAFSINGLPALGRAGAALPLHTYLPAAGAFSLRVGELKNFGSTTVQLEDRQTGTWHELRAQTSLSFEASRPDAAAARFVLHFGQARALASGAAVLPADAVSVWPNPASDQVSVRVSALPAGTDKLQLSLLNVLGQVSSRQQVSIVGGSASATVSLSGLAPGIYTLHGRSSSHTFTRSVVVR